MTTSNHPAAAVVTDFYDKLSAGDAEGLAAFVAAHFADDAELTRPESLPGGGTLAGSVAIAKFVRMAASVAKGLQLNGVYVAASPDATHVFAHVALSVGIPTTAVEWWVFKNDRAVSLTAYYWDTAAITAR